MSLLSHRIRAGLMAASVCLIAFPSLTAAQPQNAKPPEPGCVWVSGVRTNKSFGTPIIQAGDYENWEFEYVSIDKHGNPNGWACPPRVNPFQQEELRRLSGGGFSAGIGFTGILGTGGINEFAKDGGAGERLSQSNISPGATAVADLLFPVVNVGQGAGAIGVLAGPYAAATFFQQPNTTTSPGFQIGTTSTDNFAGGVELGTFFPTTQSEVITKIGVVAEHQNFFINTPTAATSEGHNAVGLQTGFGARLPTGLPGVAFFAEIDENFYAQHTFDGGPASPTFVYKDMRTETVATFGFSFSPLNYLQRGR